MILILFIFSFLNSQDIIKYPEKLPINNQEVIEHLKKKEQAQLLEDEYWDDERILFSTYFGGSGYDCINDGAFDSKGNFIQVGYTGSPDLPIVGDAFQKDKNLNHDMFIVKWNPEGDVIWSTFLGGSSVDVLYSVAIDKNDDIIVAGRTESTDIIVSENAPQLENEGGSDFYIAKFNTDGEYIWSTYWGGDKEEMQCRMVIDELGNIYLGGNTTSETMTTREDAYQRTMDKEYVLNNEWQTKSGVYLAKFTNEGNYNWGTYFATGTYRRLDPKEAKMSISLTEILTGIDVYKDEIAFSWDAETFYEGDGKTEPIFYIVTDDAEQKKGVKNAGWQTQIFKIDTTGTTLKYGTFYSGSNSLSRKVKYDKNGNLILHVLTTTREKAKKDSVFKSTGTCMFVKYNRQNELEWDFGIGCIDRGVTTYDFEIDENNVLWTVGSTSCNEIEQSVNPFPSKWGPEPGGAGLIFVFDLDNYNYWTSYEDIGISNRFDICVKNNQLVVSGCKTIGKTKNAFQSETKDRNIESGAYFKLNMKNVFRYEDTSGIDTSKVVSDYSYHLDKDKLIVISKDSINNIKLYDLNGRQLFQEKYYSNTIEINKTKYKKGVYFVIINEKKILKCLIY